MNDNVYSYWVLGSILTASKSGLFPLVASQAMQEEVLSHYTYANIAVYDWKKAGECYTFSVIEKLISNQPNKSAYFLQNFQDAILHGEDITILNSGRDMLARTGKNIVFCITPDADERLYKKAYDFCSCLTERMEFEDEIPKRGKDFQVDKSVGICCSINQSLSKDEQLGEALSWEALSDEMKISARFSDALSLLSQVEIIRMNFYGEDHPETLSVYHGNLES